MLVSIFSKFHRTILSLAGKELQKLLVLSLHLINGHLKNYRRRFYLSYNFLIKLISNTTHFINFIYLRLQALHSDIASQPLLWSTITFLNLHPSKRFQISTFVDVWIRKRKICNFLRKNLKNSIFKSKSQKIYTFHAKFNKFSFKKTPSNTLFLLLKNIITFLLKKIYLILSLLTF